MTGHFETALRLIDSLNPANIEVALRSLSSTYVMDYPKGASLRVEYTEIAGRVLRAGILGVFPMYFNNVDTRMAHYNRMCRVTIIYTLRNGEKAALELDTSAYRHSIFSNPEIWYGITKELAKKLSFDVLVMHPHPDWK